MRISKEAEERKDEILNAAEELFASKGFDGTSTNDILEKVGIARGTLYYHFKSKEDILDGLVERYNILIVGRVKEVANNKSLLINERFTQAVLALNVKEASDEIKEQIHKPQNALMHQKIQKMFINEVTPIFAEIIKEGIEEGVFNTPFPYEAIEMILVYANTIFDDDMVEMTQENLLSRIKALAFHAEKLLGTKKGSIQIMEMFRMNEEADCE